MKKSDQLKSSNISKPIYHIAYWLLVISILSFVFGRSWDNGLMAFFFISMLLPVVMGTSYFFNYFLVCRYLLKKKYFWFGLYFFYTLVVSLFLQMLVLMFTFVYLANFNLGEIDPNARDSILLAIVMYLAVFLGSFLLMVKQLNDNREELDELRDEQEKMKKSFLEIMSNRKMLRIPYDEILFIESLADYIKINTVENKEYISKEKISNVEKRLPSIFLRIHRSFIVNTEKIGRFDYHEMEVGGNVLNIGRSFKKQVMSRLNQVKPLI